MSTRTRRSFYTSVEKWRQFGELVKPFGLTGPYAMDALLAAFGDGRIPAELLEGDRVRGGRKLVPAYIDDDAHDKAGRRLETTAGIDSMSDLVDRLVGAALDRRITIGVAVAIAPDTASEQGAPAGPTGHPV